MNGAAGGSEKIVDWLGIDGCGHRDHPQLGSRGLTQPAQPGQRQVGGDVPLVNLVDDDRGDARQRGGSEQPAQEKPLGQKVKAGVRTGDLVEADRVADRRSRPFPELVGHTDGGQSGGQPARLEHPDLPLPARVDVEETSRDAGGLARTRWRLDDDRAPGPKRLADFGEGVVDGQRHWT